MSREDSTTTPRFEKVKVEIGQRFGRLVVVEGPVRLPSPSKAKPDRSILGYACVCDCEGSATISKYALLSGNTRSCGCIRREFYRENSEKPVKHGRARHDGSRPPEYSVWVQLRNRCANPNHRAWKDYGGRGITVCQRWQDSFEAFMRDLGPRPSPNHQIDRENNALGYWCGNPECSECGPVGRKPNCRWATVREQAENRRNNVYLEHDGKRLTLIEWSRVTGIPHSTLHGRISRGWPVADALVRPLAIGHKDSNGSP